MIKSFLCAGLVLCMAFASHASVIDQQNIAARATYTRINNTVVWCEGITSGMSGYVEGIDVFFSGGPGTQIQDFTARIVSSGTTVGEDTKYWDGSTGPLLFDFSSDRVFFDAGKSWTLELTGSSDAFLSYSLELSADSYPGPLSMILGGGSPSVFPGYDMRFIEYVKPSSPPVPEPASLALLGIGLAGLAGLKRKFSR